MSVVKSSVFNLYDAVSGTKHMQCKVSSDKAEILLLNAPLTIKSQQINLSNEGGNTVSDIVETVLGAQQAIVDEATARSAAVSTEASTRNDADVVLQDNVDAEAVARSAAIVTESGVRVLAEGVIDARVTSETAARVSAVNSEISARFL